MNDADTGFETTRDGAILTVTLTRTTVGNALGATHAVALADVFDEVSAGTSVRAVLLRAEGKHFCTGADLGRGGGGGRGQAPVTGHLVRSLATQHHRTVASVFSCRVPVVAAVHGVAAGFGLHLALACDMVVAGSGARFLEPFSDRGFSVDSGGSWLLPRLIGLPRAKQMLYTAQAVDAPTALAWGLIGSVVDDDELEAAAHARAAALAAGPTQALAATKQLLQSSSSHDLHQALHAESMAVELTLRSRDFKEGMTAFGERRPPEFTGE